MSFHVPEKFRFRDFISPYGSNESYGNNGLFYVPLNGKRLKVIASDGMGWEHVSVSLKGRTPFWHEMVFLKNLFWDEEDCVIQYHPPKSVYVNNCENCLHLWKPIGKQIPIPPKELVGI